jgi:hypothetical protein
MLVEEIVAMKWFNTVRIATVIALHLVKAIFSLFAYHKVYTQKQNAMHQTYTVMVYQTPKSVRKYAHRHCWP